MVQLNINDNSELNAKASPVEVSAETSFSDDSLQSNSKREQRFLMSLSLILSITLFIDGLLILLLILFVPALSSAWPLAVIAISDTCLYGVAFLFSRRLQTMRWSSWLTFVTITISLFCIIYMTGPDLPMPACLFISIILSMFLVPWWATLALGIVGLAGTFAIYLIDYQLPVQILDKDVHKLLELIIWVTALLVPTLIGVLLSRQLAQLKSANQIAIIQSANLKVAFDSINNKRRFGQTVSQRISSVTSELHSISNQQASGSQQQVAALSEIISFLVELTVTSRAIESKTELINDASQKVLSQSEDVQKISEAVRETGERGLLSVEETLENNQQVNQLYTLLTEVLLTLGQRSVKISEVVSQLKGLSNEIHLLALNAAVEAAGAGAFGERFRVVAQEVKDLANRSRKASASAEESLSEVETYIKQAASVAAGVQTQTQQAVSVAANAGEVIHELMRVISQNTQQATNIWQSASTVSSLMQEINLAASQQHSATGQAVETLRGLGTVAEQNASGSVQVASTSFDLEELSRELSQILVA